MIKRMALLTVVGAAAAGAAYGFYPNEFIHYAGEASRAAVWIWESIKANPVPAALAFGTFLLTVVYHKAKGRSLRESLEAAATRVTIVPVPAHESAAVENPVVKRAKARATRTQLLTDQVILQNRQRKLPDEVLRAEKEACYTEQAVADAERKLADKRKLHDEAVAKLDALRKELAQSETELAEIDGELQKLEQLV